MTDLFTPEVIAEIRARSESYRIKQQLERATLIIDIDLANREVIRLRTLAIDLGYHYAMSLPADSWKDQVGAVVKDSGLLKAIRDEVEATADKHAEWREP